MPCQDHVCGVGDEDWCVCVCCKFITCQIIRNLSPLLGPVAAELMAGKRKIDDEIVFLRVSLDLMTSIVARMRVATENREFDKMPGLKKEQDAAMGRFAA